MKHTLTLLCTLLFSLSAGAQQFLGANGNNYAVAGQLPYNPAFVANSANGVELHLFSASALAGTNAYRFSKSWVSNGFNGQAVEGRDYYKDQKRNFKYAWGNIDVLGPAVAFTYKNEHHVGVYTRMRQIMRAGNVNSSTFRLLGDNADTVHWGDDFQFQRAGFSTHTFSEIGFTYGRTLFDDEYHVWKGGVTLKYLMGYAAGSIYTNDLTYNRKGADTIGTLTGDVTTLYSYSARPFADKEFSNDLGSWFNKGGKNGLGLDIGVSYEYHPNGDPNVETPYLFQISAAITDLGSIGYMADTFSGTQQLQFSSDAISNLRFNTPNEDYAGYIARLDRDTLLKGNSVEKFRMGLPTAFRLNGDFNIAPGIYTQVNILLNLRGNGGDVYRPGYVNMFNVTPRYEYNNWFMVGLPVSYVGYQTMMVGLTLRTGPFYIGSGSLFSTLLANQVRNLDAYAGLSFKIKSKRERY